MKEINKILQGKVNLSYKDINIEETISHLNILKINSF